MSLESKRYAAVRTLEKLNYAYMEGAELWKPPLAKTPADDFVRLVDAIQLIQHMGQSSDALQTVVIAHEAWPRFIQAVMSSPTAKSWVPYKDAPGECNSMHLHGVLFERGSPF